MDDKVMSHIALQKGESEQAQKLTNLIRCAGAVRVTDRSSYREAERLAEEIQKAAGEVVELFAPEKEACQSALNDVCDREAFLLSHLSKARAVVRKAMSEYESAPSAV